MGSRTNSPPRPSPPTPPSGSATASSSSSTASASNWRRFPPPRRQPTRQPPQPPQAGPPRRTDGPRPGAAPARSRPRCLCGEAILGHRRAVLLELLGGCRHAGDCPLACHHGTPRPFLTRMTLFGVAGFRLARREAAAAPRRLAWEARMTDGTGLRKPRPPSAPPGPVSGPAGGTVCRVRAALGVLFPEAPARSAGRRAVYVAIEVAAVCAGAAVLLPRIAGIPAWDSVYAEDQGVFLFDALARPWHLLVPFGGYEQLMPRLVGQLVSYLPLADAAVPYALARSEEHTSERQSPVHLVCRLLLEKKKKKKRQ